MLRLENIVLYIVMKSYLLIFRRMVSFYGQDLVIEATLRTCGVQYCIPMSRWASVWKRVDPALKPVYLYRNSHVVVSPALGSFD